jgi:nuclease S1
MSISLARNHIRIIASAILASLLSAPCAWSWGHIGHRVASMMAEERLSPHALAAVHDLLGPSVSLADVSTWADEQRDIPGSSPWHYVNVPITDSRYDPKYCQPGGCVVNKVEDFKRVFQDPKSGRTEKQEALKFLVHFIEDLHQPLHVGDTGSRGGNQIQVRFYDAGSNLHRVWDSQIIERYTTDERELLGDLKGITTPASAAEWLKGTPEDWATESLRAAKEAYCLPGTQNAIQSVATLGDDYGSVALTIIQRQLAKAGSRVACTLNEVFVGVTVALPTVEGVSTSRIPVPYFAMGAIPRVATRRRNSSSPPIMRFQLLRSDATSTFEKPLRISK